MLRSVSFFLAMMLLVTAATRGQVSIGTPAPHGKALLDLTSTSKGLLIPRMTAANRAAMGAVLPEGLMVYQTDGTKGFYYYDGSAWVYEQPTAVTSITAGSGLSGGTITGTGTISLPDVGTAGTYGSSVLIPQITTDAKGRVTAVTNVPATLPDVGTAGTYGSSTFIPQITTDAKGRVTGVSQLALTPPACPGGFTTVEFPKSRLCVYVDAFTSNWQAGSHWCQAIFNSPMCTYLQIRRACDAGAITVTANLWLADRSTDDNSFYTNSTDCTNFDGTAIGHGPSAVTKTGQYCCLEYMKF